MEQILIQNNAPSYHHCKFVTNYYCQPPFNAKQTFLMEDVEQEVPKIDSIIFTKKARKEAKEPTILAALQKSTQGRRDKTRAFVKELQSQQNDGYIDAHYNAQVMYDELEKLMPLPFGYEVFKKHYNNTRY